LDCAGFNITGNNTANTYGVYSIQSQNKIKNCNIDTFHFGIYFYSSGGGSIYSTINNVTVKNSVGINGLKLFNTRYVNVTNSSFINNSILGDGGGTILDGVFVNSSGYSVNFEWGANLGTIIRNSNFTAASSSALIFSTGGYTAASTFVNSRFVSAGSPAMSLFLLNSNISNNIITGASTGITFIAESKNNLFINNTFSSSTKHITFAASASNNTVCLNNFTASTTYLSDANGTNKYNCTYNGVNQGNIYANVLNGSIAVTGSVNSSIAGLYIGTQGTGFPYSNSTSAGKFSCNFVGCQDNAPLTSTYQAPNTAPSMNTSRISPTTAYATSTLLGYCNATDADANNITYYFTWYKNAAVNTTGTFAASAPAIERNVGNITSGLAKGQNWTLQCTPYDGTVNGTAMNSSVLTISNSAPTNETISLITNATAGHWFTFRAYSDDADGWADLSYWAAEPAPQCTQYAVSQIGNRVTTDTNCTATAPATISFNVTFNDTSNANVTTATYSNTYPDNAAIITAPSVTSLLYENSTATCTAGVFSDTDGDTENVSARVFTWYVNGISVGNGATYVLSTRPVLLGENVSCSQNSTNSTWTGSYAWNMSSNVTLTGVTFVSQTPPDISSTNVLSSPLHIQYNLSGASNTTALLFYKSNNSLNDISAIINGTAETGYENESVSSTSGNAINFTLLDNEIYPHTENYNDPLFRLVAHNKTSLVSQSDYYSTEYLNVSNTSQYTFYEQMFNSTTATPVRVYACNQSAPSPNLPSSNANCVLIASVTANGNYSHCHDASNYSCHMVIPMAINNSTGKIAGSNVVVTPKMYFLIRGNNGATVNVWQIGVLIRPGATKLTTNNGNAWTNQSTITDGHLHQYEGNNTLHYYACANGTEGCSAVRSDLLDLGGLAPSPVSFTSPADNGTYILSVDINYTAALSPNAYPITHYNISLYNSTFGFVQAIKANNSLNLSYTFNITNVTAGSYFVNVRAYDNNSLYSDAIRQFNIITVNQSNGNLSQEVATANNYVHWNATVNMTGSGNCTYNVTGLLGVQNLTTITMSNGSNVSNLGNSTDPVFACDMAFSPYMVNVYTDFINQSETSVSYPLSGANQRRVLISMANNQSISYLFNYTPTATYSLQLWKCISTTDAACTAGSGYSAQTFPLVAGAIQLTTTLLSNETVYVVTWESSSSGSGGGGGGGGSFPTCNAPNVMLNGVCMSPPNTPQNLPNVPGTTEAFGAADTFLKGCIGGIPNAGIAVIVLLVAVAGMSGKKNASTTSSLFVLVALALAGAIFFYYGQHLTTMCLA
jgi:hypothetical protein